MLTGCPETKKFFWMVSFFRTAKSTPPQDKWSDVFSKNFTHPCTLLWVTREENFCVRESMPTRIFFIDFFVWGVGWEVIKIKDGEKVDEVKIFWLIYGPTFFFFFDRQKFRNFLKNFTKTKTTWKLEKD